MSADCDKLRQATVTSCDTGQWQGRDLSYGTRAPNPFPEATA